MIETQAVPRRTLGNGGSMPLIGLGSWHIFERMYIDDGLAMVTAAIEAGASFFDVGVYDGLDPRGLVAYALDPQAEGEDRLAPDRESVIGKAKRLPPMKTDIVLAGLLRMSGFARERYQLQLKLWLLGYPERTLTGQLDEALLRLGEDYVDYAVLGMYVHKIDLEQLVGDMGDAVAAGKIRGWATNNWRAADVLEADRIAVRRGLPRPQFAQNKYNVARRAVSLGAPYRNLYETTELTLQASDVLESGMLSGKLSGNREITTDPGDIQPAIQKTVVPRLVELADELGVTPAQIAVAFACNNEHVSSVLLGMSSMQQLQDNLAAVELWQKHGDYIEANVKDLCLDYGVVDPEGLS